MPATPMTRDGARQPLAPDVGVIALVPDQWTALWQPRHHVMRRLARYYNVIWMNPAPEWRVMVGGRHAAPRSAKEHAEPGWQVYDAPWYLPLVYRPERVGAAMEASRVRQAWTRLARQGAQRRVLYLWRPEFAGALDLPHDLSVYHIDDEYSFDLEATSLRPSELALIRRAGQVVIHSPRLMERKGDINPHTANIPNGVDYRAFAGAQSEPADLAGIPHPRIGYAGWLKQQLDWELLDRLAAMCPGYSFVLVGAAKQEQLEPLAAYRALRQRRNVHFLGRRLPHELAAYTQHFDVCVMPYVVTPYTDCIYPLKLHEYLATGRPTIGTPIRALQDFRDVVRLARDADEWRVALGELLEVPAQSDAAAARRREAARRHDWDILVARIARLIAQRLDHPVAEAIEDRTILPD